jgi:hypothetical protein
VLAPVEAGSATKRSAAQAEGVELPPQSSFVGVGWDSQSGKWKAKIGHGGMKQQYLGLTGYARGGGPQLHLVKVVLPCFPWRCGGR